MAKEKPKRFLVGITRRTHPFPYRTRKLSSLVPMILGWKRPGKVGPCQIYFKALRYYLRALFCVMPCFNLFFYHTMLYLALYCESHFIVKVVLNFFVCIDITGLLWYIMNITYVTVTECGKNVWQGDDCDIDV
jgi:hypothetical protein